MSFARLKLVLASGSRYRAAQLAVLGIPFTADAPEIDETPHSGESAAALVMRLADTKTRVVAGRHPGAIIVGSDQVAELDGDTIGKPGDVTAAREQLQRASGRTLEFLTAVQVHCGSSPGLIVRSDSDSDASDLGSSLASNPDKGLVVSTRVTFRTLSATEIDRYIAHDLPFDCAGAFKVEALGIALFDRIESEDPTALVGLPLIATARLLRARGFSIP